MGYARTLEAIALGFGIASAVVIIQAYLTTKYAFLKFYGISFALGVIHLALTELPLFLPELRSPENLAYFINLVSIVPVIALLYFIRAVIEIVETDHYVRLRTWIYLGFSAIGIHKLVVLLTVNSGRAAAEISLFYYHSFVWVQVLLCLVMIILTRQFDRTRKIAITGFGVYYIFNIVASLMLNLLWEFRLLSYQVYSNIYFTFAFFIDAVPLFFLGWFLRNYSIGNGEADMRSCVSEKFLDLYPVSPREYEVLELLCIGKTNKEIGETLFISHQTVKDHVHNIFKKTGVKNRTSLANLARSNQQ